jgi:tungstate transport system ATP-binding protein
VSEGVLELHDVVVEYDGRTVLEIPHLSVRRGEVLTLLGENGSGKTTLLRLLGLLIRPARGKVVFAGEQVDFSSSGRLLELRRRMAGVMQEPLLCRMSVRKNVALGLRFRGRAGPETNRAVDTWLDRLSIAHLGDRPASKLSGGEAQRTSLARAMVLKPEVVFLDEPFAALDAPTRQSLLLEFRAVLAETGVTTVFATHDRGEALALGGRVAVLMHRRVAQAGSAEAVFCRPEQVELARFVGVETLVPGAVEGQANGVLQVACGEVRLEATGDFDVGEEVWVAVRPEEIELREAIGAQPISEANVLHGRVTRTVPAETHVRVEIDCGPRVVAAVSRARFRELSLQEGSRVQAAFPARAAHLIRRTY